MNRHLVLVEHEAGQILPASWQVLSAAQNIAAPIDVVVLGDGVEGVAQEASNMPNVNSVWCFDAPQYAHFLAEECAAAIVSVMSGYSHLWCAGSTLGKSIAPRVAGLLGVGQISNVLAIHDATTYTCSSYAGSVLRQVRAAASQQILTVITTAFSNAVGNRNDKASIVKPAALSVLGLSQFITNVASQSSRPELTSARIVVSGGRGLGSKDQFKLIEDLADCLGAAVGASRAAVDSGFVTNDYQVGQTGKMVAPDLYIAIGISGAIQHLAGMKEAKTIVAINKDADAPMVQIADYAVIGDLFEIVPALIALLKK